MGARWRSEEVLGVCEVEAITVEHSGRERVSCVGWMCATGVKIVYEPVPRQIKETILEIL